MAMIVCRECGGNVSTAAPACPHCGCPATLVVPPHAAATQSAVPASHAKYWALLIGGTIVLSAAMIIVGQLRSYDSPPPRVVTAEPGPADVPAPPPPRTPAEILAATPTLEGAVSLTKPFMGDTFDKTSPGTSMLAAWALMHMTWTDAAPARDETSIALVLKDPDEARGRRMCAPGSLIEIAVAKTDLGKLSEGLLMTDAMNLVRFEAVGSSGSLVKDSPARFCGVVVGRFDYSNSGGGTGHAVQIVGMFDLPENRKTAMPVAPTTPAVRAAVPSQAKASFPKPTAEPVSPAPLTATPPPAAPRGNCGCASGDLTCATRCSSLGY